MLVDVFATDDYVVMVHLFSGKQTFVVNLLLLVQVRKDVSGMWLRVYITQHVQRLPILGRTDAQHTKVVKRGQTQH